MFDPRRMFWMKRRGWGGFRGGPFGDQDFDDGPFGKGGHGPGRQRQRRGDIKFVLLELLKDQPRHGYELIKILEERSSGFYRPSAGVIYPTLQLLEEEGSVTSETTDGKKVYTITDAGRKLLEEQEESWGPGFGPRWGHHFKQNMPQMMEMQQAIRQLFESTMQAARYGTPEQVQAVQKVLKSAAKEVHAILAQGDASETNGDKNKV